MNIDLSHVVPGCDHFYWSELLYLRKWDVYAHPSVEQANNLIHICQKLELVREMFKSPIHITSGLRPGIYNSYIGGAKNSYHKKGMALDFVVNGFTTFAACNMVRDKIKPHLETLNVRMENMSTANWVHLDLGAPGPSGRFFRP